MTQETDHTLKSAVGSSVNDELHVHRPQREPLAIVGLGCRFPGGANSPQAYWEMLIHGLDGVIDTPPERWNLGRFYSKDPALPGKMAIRKGGFLREPIDGFDPLFFGISPRDAEAMDPQQRILLELVWEAMEDAGQDMEQLNGSDTGVYIGGFMQDFTAIVLNPLNRSALNASSAIGVNLAMLANRISHAFNFTGPSIAMDTACSSSLVSFHQACQALWHGECSLVVTGGINLMIRPEYNIALNKGQFLAHDGRSKSFDSRGDGYGRGEGGGIVIVKPLAAALRDNDRIYALVHGTGVNQDGHTNGITVPNAKAQQALIDKVCSEAKVARHRIRYVEAHGTGTALGDPTECKALGAVYGAKRPPGEPCIVGSVKANIGHLEAAAGVAGLIKAALCLHHKQIPPQANLEKLNPNIPFDRLNLHVPRKLESLPPGDGPAFAGINSFGYGGTNAHVVLSEAFPSREPDPLPTDGRDWLLPLSGRCQAGLSALAGRWLTLVSAPDAPALPHLCRAAGVRRTHLDHRMAFVANSTQALADQLREVTAPGAISPPKSTLTAEQASRPVFVMTGNGPQWWGMGQTLLKEEPLFRQVAEECDALFKKLAGWSIIEEMLRSEADSRITQTQFAQPGNFVLQVGLAALLRSWGLVPAAIVGHSLGEVSASYLSGILSLEDAIQVSYHRSRLQQRAVGTGRMLSVGLVPEECEKMLADCRDKVAIAAINSPVSTNLAGDATVLATIAEKLKEQGKFNRFLRVDIPFHSPAMDPLKPELYDSLLHLQPRISTTPLYSTVTAKEIRGTDMDAKYWVANLREPVLFSATMDQLIQDGYGLFIEIGPHPVLATSIQECLRHRNQSGETLHALHRDKPERSNLLEMLGKLYTIGYPVNWEKLYPDNMERHVQLPAYPWQRNPYWSESDASQEDRKYIIDHMLLGQRRNTPHFSWESALNTELLPYLNDHRVDQSVVFPGAGYVEIGLAMHRAISKNESCLLEKIRFHQALVLGTHGDTLLHMAHDPKKEVFTIHGSRPDAANPYWTLHASGSFAVAPPGETPALDLAVVQRHCTESVDAAKVYARLDAMGLHYGPWFRGIQQLWQGENALLIRVAAHSPWTDAEAACCLHPTLLDACFHALMMVMKGDEGLYLPIRIQSLCFYATPTSPFWGYIQVTEFNSKFIECDLTLCDDNGRVYAAIEKLHCKAMPTGQFEEEATAALDRWLYRPGWEKQGLPELQQPLPSTEDPVVVLLDKETSETMLAQPWADEKGGRIVHVNSGHAFRQEGEDRFWIKGHDLSDLERLLTQVGRCRSLVCLWGLATEGVADDPVGINPLVDALGLIQAIVKTGEKQPVQTRKTPRLFLVTRGAQPVLENEKVPSLALSPIVGLARVAVNEHSDLRCTLLDLDPDDATLSLAPLVREVLADGPETEVAWRSGQRLVSRLVRDRCDALTQKSGSHPLDTTQRPPFVVELGRPGDIDSLCLRGYARRPPGPGELEIEVHAAGVSIKDLMRVIHRDPEPTPEKTFFGDEIGMEISGVVTRTGPGINTPARGETVLAIVPGGLRSHVTLPLNAIWTMPRPQRIGDAESGGILIAFLTAHFSLHRAALGTGEKVLIHTAHCAIGLAAVQIAQWRGAELFVTADTPEKRNFLRSLGVRHVYDSRFPTCIEQIMEATEDRGVDVIFSTVGGESGRKSVTALAPFGRFIEIGENDTYRDESWTLASMDRNISFMSVDLDHLVRCRSIMPSLLEDIAEQFHEGAFKPVHTHVFPADRVAEAFKHVQDHHLGKAVLDMRGTGPMIILPQHDTQPLFRADGTYLITGGFGSFGLELAHWMGRQGVRQMVLIGRRGADSALARQAVATLESNGIRVMAAAVDVTDPSEVTRLIDDIDQTMPPLRGIVHGAAVLDDGLIMDLNRERMIRVMGPKALGAWNLHLASKHLPLDFFVLFSSVSSLIGNGGQGNYVAANAFLDALAHARKAEGLPATSINWGALGETGMAARDKEVELRLQRGGIHSISMARAMSALARVLRWNQPQLGVIHMDWEAFAQTNPLVTRIPRYSPLVTADTSESGRNKTPALVQQLRENSPTLRRNALVDHIRTLVAKILRIPNIDRILPHVPLFDLGIDSLTAVELKNNLEATIGVSLGTSIVFNYPTIDALAGFLDETLFSDGPQKDTHNQAAVQTTDPKVEQLSEEDAEALLLKELLDEMNQNP